MNERIRELAGQARAQYCDLSDASCFKRLGLVEAVVFKPEDLEKFAELVVRECALTAGLMEHEGRKGIGAQILDNFGVEE
jgi:enoyl-CoA hydratase/carnithine racemase